MASIVRLCGLCLLRCRMSFPKFDPGSVVVSDDSAHNDQNPPATEAAIRAIPAIPTLSGGRNSKNSRFRYWTEIMAIPLRPCYECERLTLPAGRCEYYTHVLPDPIRKCRCVHFLCWG